MKLLATALCLLVTGGPAFAVDLSLPAAARMTAERNTGPDTYAAPAGVFSNDQVVTLVVEGDVRRAAWRIDQSSLRPLQIIQPLRTQLEDAGFEILLDCAEAGCGGFDFRFATETLPGPNMYVNIRAYHFVTAVRPSIAQPEEVVTLLASASANSAYVQIIQAGQLSDDTVTTDAPTPGADNAPQDNAQQDDADLPTRLLSQGHAVLRDLDFETGTSDLPEGTYASLAAIADLMRDRPNLRIALVGHTDTVGGLAGNISLSKRRAQSVRQRLVGTYSIAPERMEAEGMGYLAPVASNLGAEGREANRRVEVIVLGE